MTVAPIEMEGLSKRFGAVQAVDGVDLTVEAGEIFGYLGPNGAGKTTTIRLLLDFVRPTSGTARLLGGSGADPAVRGRVGYLPGELRVDPIYTADRLIDFYGALRGGVDRGWVSELLERFDLDPGRPFGQLSTGNRRKVGIVQAFMHRPELYLLDEPTSGLDPLLQHEFYALVREVVAEGGDGAAVEPRPRGGRGSRRPRGDRAPRSPRDGHRDRRPAPPGPPTLLLVFGIGLGAGAIAGSEQDGTLELLLANPVSRRRLALERYAASMALLGGLAAVFTVVLVGAGAPSGALDGVSLPGLLAASAGAFGLAALHGTVAFTTGAITGRRAPALAVATAIAVAGYLLQGLLGISSAVHPARFLTPWHWYLGRNMLAQGIAPEAIVVPLLLSIALAAVGLTAFDRRDLR